MANTKKVKARKMRKAMSIFELIMVIGLVGIFLGIVIWMWVGAKGSLDASALQKRAMTVISGVEKVKNDYNSGAYLASGSTAIPGIQKLKYALGGTKGTNALGGWKYSCPSGNSSTITIISESIKDTDTINGAALTISDKYSDWVASRSGNTLVLKRTNSVCK